MKALKIIGYILTALIVSLVILIWFLIFPFSGDSADKIGFAFAVVIYFIIFIIASAVPFILGIVGIIMSSVKQGGKGVGHFIVITVLPALITVLMLLSLHLV
ncbi:MAG: hypothetical protein II980_06975 [Clostridia bacterium]|nr:hypothetical protein [Clostridia bacterium]